MTVCEIENVGDRAALSGKERKNTIIMIDSECFHAKAKKIQPYHPTITITDTDFNIVASGKKGQAETILNRALCFQLTRQHFKKSIKSVKTMCQQVFFLISHSSMN